MPVSEQVGLRADDAVVVERLDDWYAERGSYPDDRRRRRGKGVVDMHDLRPVLADR
jgi:hypothetical protein